MPLGPSEGQVTPPPPSSSIGPALLSRGRGLQSVSHPIFLWLGPPVPFSTVLGTLPSPARTHLPHKSLHRVVLEERPLHAQQQGLSAGPLLPKPEAAGDDGQAQLPQGQPHRRVTLQAAPASAGAQAHEQHEGQDQRHGRAFVTSQGGPSRPRPQESGGVREARE